MQTHRDLPVPPLSSLLPEVVLRHKTAFLVTSSRFTNKAQALTTACISFANSPCGLCVCKATLNLSSMQTPSRAGESIRLDHYGTCYTSTCSIHFSDFKYWITSSFLQPLEDGAGKRCSECALILSSFFVGLWRWGKREILYLSLHCHHQNDSCIEMGSDGSSFNVLLIVRDKVTRQCRQRPVYQPPFPL